MKFLVVSALVAAASAEAQFGYAGYPYAGHGYGLGYGYGGLGYAGYSGLGHVGYPHAAVPFGSSSGLDPITQGLDPVTQGYYGKREADAEADPQYLASPYTGYSGYGLGYSGYPYSAAHGYGNLGYAGLGYGNLGHAGLAYGNLGYSGLGYLGTRGYYGKRDADADPQILASPYAGYTNAGYGLGYSGSTGILQRTKRQFNINFTPFCSNNACLAQRAVGLGYLGTRGYYGKRDADADPQILASPYAGYTNAGYGLGYSGYPYSAAYGYGNLGYAGLGYAGYAGAGLGYGYPYAASAGACRNYLGAAVPC